MQKLFWLIMLLGVAPLLQSCDDDDDDNDVEPEEMFISEDDVRSVFNVLPPTGYESSFYNENLPSDATGLYNAVVNDQNVLVGAVANLTGEVIIVTPEVVQRSFVNMVNYQESIVNGIDVYQAMDGRTYRAVIFRGQYLFDISLPNDPDPGLAADQAADFIELMTGVMAMF